MYGSSLTGKILVENNMSSKMKVLVVDIETSPNLTWAWNNMLWTSPIPHNYVIEPSRMLTWAAKWVDGKKVYFRHDEQKDFLPTLWELLDKADAVVHYNGKKFDRKYINTEFIEAGMVPPTLAHDIDLYPTIRKTFSYPSYKLDYVAGRLLDENKLKHAGVGLWFAYT